MILTHGANSVARCGGDFVEIGGREYRTVKIGNQLWMAENLDYKFQYNGSILPIGGSWNTSTPNGWYYNNNETDYGIDGTYKFGLLYNWYAVKYLDDNKATLLPDGWRVPDSGDFDALAQSVGGLSTAGKVLKALNNSVTSNYPSGWNGTDEYGFKALPSGLWSENSFYYKDEGGYFYALDLYNSSFAYYEGVNTSDAMWQSHTGIEDALSLRLVKDAT
jgi:uncharacterized protein (TIGR02145 family)